MNVINYNHDFINIEIPSYIVKEYGSFNVCKKCSKCNMIVAVNNYNRLYYDDFFFLNGIEIFAHINDLEELNLTCEELQIKLLLE